MKSFKDQGFTIRIRNYSESDSIVTVISKYHGRIDALAKGVRKIKSHKMGNLDLLALSKFSFYRGRNLDLLLEAKLENNYLSEKSLDKTIDFLNMSAVLNYFLQAGDTTRKVFEELFELFENIDYKNYKILLISFYLKFLELVGYEPNLYSCLKCEEIFRQKEVRYKSYAEMGFLCDKHKADSGIKISDTSIKTLRFLKENPISRARNLKFDSDTQKSINSILNNWLQIVTSNNLKIKRILT